MAAPRFAWGIDVGNRALKAVKLVSTADGLVIDDFDVIEHETILSAAGDNRDSLIQSALATFVSRHPGIEKGQVGVGVTGQQSFARFIKLPPVEPRKVPEIVRFEALQQIPFPLDEVEWSYQLFQDPESPDIEVGIFAMRKELVNQHIKFFTDAKLNVQAVQMNPLSVYNAMYYDSRIKGATMIIDVGAENTDLIIAEGESIWLRSISIGGNAFTEALSKSFKVNFEKAEDLKRNAATSKYGKQIMQAMRPMFADLVSEIQRSIGFYSSVHKESRVNRVIAIGSTFRLPGLERYLAQNLSLDVKKLDALGTGAIEDPKLAASLGENLLSAAGAYGLALQVMGQGKISSSLLPEHIKREKMWSEKTKWFVAAAAVFVVGAIVPYARWYIEDSALKSPEASAANANITSLISTARRLDTEWQTVESSGAAQRQQILNNTAMVTGRDFWPQINTLIHSALPQFAPDGQKELQSENIDDIKKIPRGQRNQIIISNMVSTYYPDLSQVLKASQAELGRYADVNVTGNPPLTVTSSQQPIMSNMLNPNDPNAMASANAKQPRGFVLTVKLMTPNYDQGAALIDKFNNTLKGLTATPDRPLEVQATSIISRVVVGDDAVRMKELAIAYQTAQRQKQQDELNQAGPGGAPGQPPMDQPGVSPAGLSPSGINGNSPESTKVPDEAYQDPVLKEDIRKDVECVVVLVVVLDPSNTKPASGGTGKAIASIQ